MNLAIIDAGDLFLWTVFAFFALCFLVYGWAWAQEYVGILQRKANDSLTDLNRPTRNTGVRWRGLSAKKAFKKVNKKMAVKLHLREAGVTCPLCLDEIENNPQTCSGCSTAFHRDCLTEMNHGRCSTQGCKRRVATW